MEEEAEDTWMRAATPGARSTGYQSIGSPNDAPQESPQPSGGPHTTPTRGKRKKTEFIVFFTVCALLLIGATMGYVLGRGGVASNGHPSRLHLAVLGDWSKKTDQGSNQPQLDVANSLVASAKKWQYHAVLSTGDNFYEDGIGSAASPRWDSEWHDVYCRDALHQTPWIVCLGNHDYRGNVSAQLAKAGTHPNWVLPSRYYLAIVPVPREGAGGAALLSSQLILPRYAVQPAMTVRPARQWQVLRGFQAQGLRGPRLLQRCVALTVIDTNPLDPRYFNHSQYDIDHPMMETNLKFTNKTQQVNWIAAALQHARATCAWSFLVGHSSPYSGGSHGNNTYLDAHLAPLMREYAVDAGFFGHDHILQHVQHDGMDYFVSGGGSVEENGVTVIPGFTRYANVTRGFLDVVIEESPSGFSSARFQFIDTYQRVLYEYTKRKGNTELL